MIKKVKIKYGIIGELIILFALASYLIYENYLDGSIGTFFPNSKTDYIKWVDFDVCSSAMGKAYEYDVESQTQEVKLNWIELLAYLGTRYGGDFSRYKEKDLNELVRKLQSKEESIGALTEELKYYNYYYEAYSAVLGGFVGEYQIQVPSEENPEEKVWVKKYGLKAFLPIAKYFPYSDYDDFGVSRSYGYKRRHLGHDMMGQTGTPVIAVESGYVEALGWNQYGGWRIGIRSFDGKRYYYYAHLRKNFPYNKSLVVGSIIQAGDVIGYLGRTGYSANENVNNIDTPHLHFGMQLIFDESQKEGYNEIWIDCYDIIKFLYRNRSETVKNTETKEWYRIYEMKDPAVDYYIQNKDKIKNTNIKHNTDESSPGEMKEENQGNTQENNGKEENPSIQENNSKEENQGNAEENKNQEENQSNIQENNNLE
ncbi:peptidoglycan DD-metalloendopeptidase family protein [Anaerocolumna sedimenticola]|uniref:Peptidoglycan DD-metalloendopeptidase family protein n=1 Tax=Anaerocolumna sedimenticola TaxID=2696063 RepID=A0A6P1TNX7_9FIRM|nr:M23 family metallopeptidase [Anaerocolumna sedimenticola]QHQ61335.1 peptidoglycan DD-metalloendopeptidase family protein [Anaerocolumna sedimenticola]